MRHVRPGLALLAAVLLAATPAGAGSGSPARNKQAATGNLIQNPGGEAAAGATSFGGVVKPPSWETTSNLTVVGYSVPDSPAVPAGGGNNYFAGGPGSASSTATQTVDVSAHAQSIDAGSVDAKVSAQIGGYSGQTDAGTVRFTFLSSAAAELGGVTLGPVTPADRNSQSQLLPRTATQKVTSGTRTIRVVLTATRLAGDYNDGYFDNIELVLDDAAAPTAVLRMSEANKNVWEKSAQSSLYATLAFCPVVNLGGTGAILAAGFAKACEGAVTGLITAGIVLEVDPPDTRYTQVAMPKPFKAPTVGNSVCRAVRSGSQCSRLKVALIGFGTADGRVASITEATAITANRARNAQTARNTRGIAIQQAAARAYWGAYAFALKDRAAAAKRLAREFQRAQTDVSVSPAQQQEGVSALGELKGVPAPVVRRFEANGFSRDQVRQAIVAALRLVPSPTGPVSVRSVLLENVNTNGLTADYRRTTVTDVARVLDSLRAQRIVSASTAATLRTRLSRAQNASRRRSEMRQFVAITGQRVLRQPHSRFLQVAAAPLAGLNIGLGVGTPAKQPEVSQAQAISRVRRILNRNAGRCRLTIVSTSARRTTRGWRVSAVVNLPSGPGTASWNVEGRPPGRATAADPLAAEIEVGCRG